MRLATRAAALVANRSALFSDEAKALFARMTTQPTYDRQVSINRLIVNLKNAGVWANLYAFYVTAAPDSQAALLNWVSTSYNLTAVSSPTFTADRGFQGNGSSSYLRTGYQGTGPSEVTNHNLGVWINTGQDSKNAISGSSSLSYGIVIDVDRVVTHSANATADTTFGGPKRYVAISRNNNASSYQTNIDGVIATITSTANQFGSGTDYVLLASGTAGPYSTGRAAAAHIGAGLTSTQLGILYAELNTYLIGIGAA